MKVIIAGSRGITNPLVIDEAVEKAGFDITTIVSGTARGVDQLGEDYAKRKSIKVERHPAKWDQYGKAAGYIRNEKMALNSDALIAVSSNPLTKVTGHMIDIAKAQKLKLYIHKITLLRPF